MSPKKVCHRKFAAKRAQFSPATIVDRILESLSPATAQDFVNNIYSPSVASFLFVCYFIFKEA